MIGKFEESVNNLVKQFEKHTNLDFDFWIGDNFATIASFSCEYCFTLEQIYEVLKKNISVDWLLHWYDYNTDRSLRLNLHNWSINLATYCKLRNGQDLTDSHFASFLDDFLK